MALSFEIGVDRNAIIFHSIGVLKNSGYLTYNSEDLKARDGSILQWDGSNA